VHANHLDRPLKMTDGSQAIVWVAVHRPFGDVHHGCQQFEVPGSRALIGALLQRILLNRQHAADAVQGSRIGTASLREGALLHAPSI
jgi:hypothetical protein